jgi:hypothetical protein
MFARVSVGASSMLIFQQFSSSAVASRSWNIHKVDITPRAVLVEIYIMFVASEVLKSRSVCSERQLMPRSPTSVTFMNIECPTCSLGTHFHC